MAYKAVLVVVVVVLCSLSNSMSNAEDGPAKAALRANMKRLHPQHHLRAAVHRSITRLKTIQTSISSAIKPSNASSSPLPLPSPSPSLQGAGIEAPLNSGGGEFAVTISIGTPPTKVVAIMDTGSDLIWTQCQPCSTACFPQPDPLFDPSKSTTYAKVPCDITTSLCSALPRKSCTPDSDCEYSYGYGFDGSVRTSGVLSVETLSMSDTSGRQYSIPHIAFGCSHESEGSSFSNTDGIVGLGGGDLSLISQLGSLVDSKFSYCLVPVQRSETSPLLFGSVASVGGEGAKSTPIHTNPAIKTFYYLSVEGISVGNSAANIPEGTFDIKGDGNGGFIIDSGTTFTFLPHAAFTAVAQLLDSAVGLPRSNDDADFSLCYQLPSGSTDVAVPDITYHFGGGADYVIKGQYSFGILRDTNSLCFLTLDMGASSDAAVAIFGNRQQQNYHILYDNTNHMLSFAPADCASL